MDLYWKAADGTGDAELLMDSLRDHAPSSMSPDGERLVVREIDRNVLQGDLVVVSLSDGVVESALASSYSELNAEISNDGRWLAYQSNESGRFEIFVRPFPDIHSRRWQVSTDGGTAPLWGPDGKELFFVALDGRLMRVPVEEVQAGESFQAGSAEVQLETAMFTSVGRTYDISPDGERFLVIRERATLVDRSGPGAEDVVDPEGGVAIQIVLNWFQELERLAPAMKR